MCHTCGCEDPENKISIRRPDEEEHGHTHDHVHDHSHEYDHEHDHSHDGNEKHHHQHQHKYKHSHKHNDHDHKHDHDEEDAEHAHNHFHEDQHEHHSHSHEKNHKYDHHDHHDKDHSHVHHHHDKQGTKIIIEQNILQKNNLLAERNRGYFEAKNILTLNLVSSPGSGKTSLLERTIKEMKSDLKLFIIEGDQQTMNDAKRIEAAGAPVVQINTGNGCHLDSEMINQAVKKLDVTDNSVLIIENVGNLVCPSMFDLGEAFRVVVISVTEGEDKPLKYPNMFQTSNICIINKTDLLPYVDFDVTKAKEYALRVNKNLVFFELSVKTGEGMNQWYEWLKNNKK